MEIVETTAGSFVQKMQQLLSPTGNLIRRLSLASMRNTRTTVSAWLAVFSIFLIPASTLRIETSISSLLDTSTPSWDNYQRSLERHGGDEFVSIILESDRPLGLSTIRRTIALTRALEDVPGVSRVDSLASVSLIRSTNTGEVQVDPAFGPNWTGSPSETREIAEALREDPISRGAYISEDQRVLAINVVLDTNVVGDRSEVVRSIEELAGIDALVSGVPVFRTKINSDTQRETFALLPFVLILMGGILLFFTRSLIATALPICVGGLGTIATMGALGATSVPLTISTMILPSVQLALGCAYAMHLVSSVSGVSDCEEAEYRVSSVVAPVALSGITTTVGFLSLSTSSIEAIRHLALYGAFGVFVITLACVSLLPALIALRIRVAIFPETAAHTWIRDNAADALAELCRKNSTLVAVIWSLVAIVSIAGLAQLNISTDIVSWYDTETKIRRDYEQIREKLSGITPVSILIESTEGRTVLDPDVIAAIDSLSAELELRPDVGKVMGINHPLRAMQKAYHGGAGSLPDSREETSQYLLVLESEEAIWDLVSRDSQSARVLLRLDDNGSDSIVQLAAWAEDWWDTNGPPDFGASSTGVMLQFAKTNQAIVRTQVWGLSLALAGVGVALLLLLGSSRLAVAAMIPNVLPLAAAYGTMGYLGIPLDAGTACLGSLALGIAVDDTVHIVSHWSRERNRGMDGDKAIKMSLKKVIPALTLSTACIVCGFGVLGLSDLGLVRNLGLLTSSVVLICWIADVTLLPVLLRESEKIGIGD